MIEINQLTNRRTTHDLFKQVRGYCTLYSKSGRGTAMPFTKASNIMVDSVDIKIKTGDVTSTESFPFTPEGMQSAATFMANLANVSPKKPSLAKEGDLMGASA